MTLHLVPSPELLAQLKAFEQLGYSVIGQLTFMGFWCPIFWFASRRLILGGPR